MSSNSVTSSSLSCIWTGKIDGLSTVQKFKIPPSALNLGDVESLGNAPKAPRPSLLGMNIMAKLGMAFRQKVKDVVIDDLTKVAKGDGPI